MQIRRPGGVSGRTIWPLALLLLMAGAAPAAGHEVLDPRTEQSERISSLWWFMLVVAALVCAVVIFLVLAAVLRRGEQSGVVARAFGSSRAVPIAGVIVPLAILVVLFWQTLETLQVTAPAKAARAQLTIDVTGQQWWWSVRYPNGAVTANEMHVPTGTRIRLRLHSRDVLHSWWVPELNRKVDLIPGLTNYVDFSVRDPGVFRGQCAELCGLQHANMAIEVVAEPPSRFARWLRDNAAAAQVPATGSERTGRQVFESSSCASCHTIRGTKAGGDVGPDLTHLASRSSLAAVTLPNRPADLAAWVLDPQHYKPGNKMPAVDLPDDQVQPLLDYLQSLK